MATIKFRRGNQAGLPVLAEGEPGWTTDTFRLYVGASGGVNKRVGGTVDDGDYGQITVSAGGTTWTIDNGTVTVGQLANLSGTSLLIGTDSGDAVPREITVGARLSMSAGGVLSADVQGGSPAGSDTQVQFNDSGAFGGDSGMVFNKTTNVLTVGHLVSSGAVLVPGTGTNTYQASNSGPAATTTSMSSFSTVYGASNDIVLGDPVTWLRVNVGGQDYVVPCYAPSS